jgi:N-methylhydantoinase A
MELWRLGVDIGGTFTDLALEGPGGAYTAKVLTTPETPDEAVLRGIEEIVATAKIRPADLGVVIHGTTLATNALIERKGARTALVTTAGFRDAIELGTESRFEQYDLDIEKPSPLIPRSLRFAVPERLSAAGEVLVPLDDQAVQAVVPDLVQERIESVAVALLHSYVNPAHERRIRDLLQAALPGLPISLSSDVSPEIREYERFSTTCANAFIQPLIARYLTRLGERLRAAGASCPLLVMLSSGGVTDLETAVRFPVRLIESGPAGGAILASHVARQCDLDRAVSVDMGGTTAKLCLLDRGQPQAGRDFEAARVYRFKPGSGLPVRVPVIEMMEIGAGGGSLCGVDALGRITVGPESAGAAPGPACYGRGGTGATVTDANLILGRIDPHEFAGGRMALDPGAAESAVHRHVGSPLALSAELAALGIVEMVDENMANAAREHAVESGKTVPGRTLIAFGGSAPLHAARLARRLGITRVIVPSGAGVGSAIGFLRAPVAFEVVRSRYQRLGQLDGRSINPMLAAMSAEAHVLVARGAPDSPRQERRVAYMRYVGQGHEVPVELPPGPIHDGDDERLGEAFDAAYQVILGRLIPHVDVEILTWAVRVSTPAPPIDRAVPTAPVPPPAPVGVRRLIAAETGEAKEALVYRRSTLLPGMRLRGPALVVEDDTTTIAPDGFEASVNSLGYVVLEAAGAR